MDYVQIKEATRINKTAGDIDTVTDFNSDNAHPINDQSRIKPEGFKPRYKPWRQDQRFDNNRSTQQYNGQHSNQSNQSQQQYQDSGRAQNVSFQQQTQPQNQSNHDASRAQNQQQSNGGSANQCDRNNQTHTG